MEMGLSGAMVRGKICRSQIIFFAGAALLACFVPNRFRAQSPVPNPLENQGTRPVEGSQAAAPGGVNTGGAHTAVLDAQHRPITAGGFVASGPVIFQDIAKQAGLNT